MEEDFLVLKNVTSKQFWDQKNLGQTQILVHKKIWLRKIMGLHYLHIQQVLNTIVITWYLMMFPYFSHDLFLDVR